MTTIAAITEPTLAPTRPLSAIERQVVTCELQADARGMRFVGYFATGAALVFGGFTYALLERGSWLMAFFVGATSAAFAWLSLTILRKRTWGGVRELQAFEATMLCETRRTGKHEHLYVGPFRVALRRGWHEFWPEGQVVRAELCLPPVDLGATWAAAVVVSLPGIDIQTWHVMPPPKPRPWLLMVAVLSGLFAVVTVVVSTSGNWWQTSMSAVRNAGRELVFEDVAALDADATAWLSRVTIRRAFRVHLSHGDDYLCDLTDPSALTTSDSDADASLPSEAEIEAQTKKVCNVEERAAQLAELMNNLYRRQRQHDNEPRPLESSDVDRPPQMKPASEQVYRNVALKECREAALGALRRERMAQRRQNAAALLRRAVFADPTNTCFAARFDAPVPVGVTALENQAGVLDVQKTWRSNAPAPSLVPIVCFGLFGIVTACCAVGWRLHRRRYLEETAAWKQRIAQRGTALHAAPTPR